MADTPQPLAPEEEKLYRNAHAYPNSHHVECIVCSFIATLDRDRARIAALEGALTTFVVTAEGQGWHYSVITHLRNCVTKARAAIEDPRHD